MSRRALSLALVDPGSSRHELNEPIGIDAVASAAAAHGHCVRQYFAPVSGLPDVRVLAGTDIVGLSMPLGSLETTRRLAADLRALPQPRRPRLVLGGLLPTFATDQLLAEFPEAILVVGEGEDAIAGILEATSAQSPSALTEVPNLAFRHGGSVVHSPRRLVDLAGALSPARAWVRPVAARGGIVRAEGSRGCSWGRCTFCAIQHKYCDEARWREISIDRIIAELEELSRFGVRHPYYTDEDFVGSDPARAVALADAIVAAKADGRIAPDLTLYLDMRVASIVDRGGPGRPSGRTVLEALRRAGLREVFVGIESGSREQVRRYKKPATAARNLQALALLRELGISADVGFIFFDPEMSIEEAVANLEFLRESRLWSHDARLTKEVRVEAGTPLVEQYRDRGLLVGPLDVDDLTFPYRWLDHRVEAAHTVERNPCGVAGPR